MKTTNPQINFGIFWEYCISALFLFIAVFAFGIYGSEAIVPAYVAGGLILCLLIWTDLKYKLLPDAAVLALFGLSVIMTIMTESINDIHFGFLGALSGFLFAWAIRLCYYGIRECHGLGFGDCKLFGAVGMWVGLDIFIVIWLSAVVMMLIFMHTSLRSVRTPFALPICIVTVLHIMRQESIDWYPVMPF